MVLSPKGDYDPTESETWKLVIETDPNPISPEKLEQLTKPKIASDMDPHDPIFAEVYEPPKVSSPGQRPEKSPFRGASPKPPGGSSGPHTPRNSPAPGLAASKTSSPAPGAAPSLAAALASQPNSGPPSRARTPKPDEPIPVYETNSIGGTRRIAQSSSFNKLLQSMTYGGE